MRQPSSHDADIAFVVIHFKTGFESIETVGVRSGTLIALATDHGESLFEHDEAGHSVFLCENTLRSAVILSSPALSDGSFRVEDAIRPQRARTRRRPHPH